MTGTLHRAMLRGLAGGQIVADDADRATFLGRLGTLAEAARHLDVSTSGIAKALARGEAK